MGSLIPDPVFNVGLAFVFITAASWLASRLKFSSIPFLILAGMLVGPHAPELGAFSFNLIYDSESIELLSRLGVLLLLFYLGLEFSARKLVESGKTLLKGGIFYVAFNFMRGLGFGWLFFDTWPEALVVAGVTGISSSAIITKLLVDFKRTANPETELVLGIMVIEDVFIAVYLSVLSGIMISGSLNIWQTLASTIVILVFIISIILFGQRLGAMFEKRFSFRSSEFFVIATFTMLMITGVLAERLHIAEAIGALLLGLVMAETTHNHRFIQIITPMRDLFGAVFFFSFGMAIDYRAFGEVITVVAIAVFITIFGNIINGMIASWLSGYKGRRAVNVAFTIIARGEFSIIVANFAAMSGMSGKLPAFAALYVLVLAFVSPALAKNTKLFYELINKSTGLFSKSKPS